MYSADLGRFIQTDPIGMADDMNLYAYVGNNAVNYSDPSGLVKWRDFAFGAIDFTLSTGAAGAGLFGMIASPVLGPAAPAGYWAATVSVGILGMPNSSVAIKNAVYDTSGPTVLEDIFGILFGPNGAKFGVAADTFIGFRPAAIASGGIKSANDVYDIASGLNTLNGTISAHGGSNSSNITTTGYRNTTSPTNSTGLVPVRSFK